MEVKERKEKAERKRAWRVEQVKREIEELKKKSKELDNDGWEARVVGDATSAA